MAGALRTWASCWLATSAIAPAALAEAAARECAAQDCEFEDNSLLSIRRVGTQQHPTKHIVSPSSYTQADTGDDIEVFWLMAVLSPVSQAASKLGNGTKLYNLTTELVGLYHTGIGFRNKRTGLESVAQYDALPFGLNIIVPTVNSTTWTWNRSTALELSEGGQFGQFNKGYWNTEDIVKVAVITGSDYNELVEDMIDWDPSKSTRPYVVFTPSLVDHEVDIQPHLPGVPAAPGLPPGSETCNDVAALVLHGIQEIAGSQVFVWGDGGVADITRVDPYLWMKPGTKAVKLDISGGLGSPDYDFALKFFSAMQGALHDPSWIGRLEDLFHIAGGDWVFTDVHNDYWRITPNIEDPLGWRTSTVPCIVPLETGAAIDS